MLAVAYYQKINLLDKVILAYLGGLSAIIGGIIWYFSSIPQEQITLISSVASNLILFTVIIGFILLGVRARINVYESFIDGAKDSYNFV